jgi:hypothetical protein
MTNSDKRPVIIPNFIMPTLLTKSEFQGFREQLYNEFEHRPIFGQVICTLFRAIQHDNLDKAYKSVAEALYQDFLRQDREIAKVS